MKSLLYKWFILLLIVINNSITGRTAFFSTIDTALTNKLNDVFENDTDNDNDEIAAAMQIKVYTGQSMDTSVITDIPITETQIIYKYIDKSKPLVFYIHGYREGPSDENIQTIVAVHLERGTDNIFILDWSKLGYDKYTTVFSKIKNISQIFATTFDRIIELGFNIERSHIIGHSMGGQIAGLAGKYSKYTIPRVTGLDPASPGFYYFGVDHIDSTSGRFVDIIHTDGGFYGALPITGTVDIYPNGGTRPQPGCEPFGVPLTPTDLCSHWRSWRYYAESVRNINAFVAKQCDSYFDYKLEKCNNNRAIYIGYDIPTDARGLYYLTTNDQSPYGKNNY